MQMVKQQNNSAIKAKLWPRQENSKKVKVKKIIGWLGIPVMTINKVSFIKTSVK